jgi:hypothetical protein
MQNLKISYCGVRKNTKNNFRRNQVSDSEKGTESVETYRIVPRRFQFSSQAARYSFIPDSLLAAASSVATTMNDGTEP